MASSVRSAPYATDSATRRKNNKPLMEKKRRERINKCLNELQALLLDSTKDHSHSKLEKADILEMTVKHLRNLRRQTIGIHPVGGSETQYRAGYQDCASRVTQCINHISVDETMRKSVVGHIGCANGTPALTVQIPTPPTSPVSLTCSPTHVYQGSFVPIQGGVALVINQQVTDSGRSLSNIVSHNHSIQAKSVAPTYAVSCTTPEKVWRPWDIKV